jgi:preprotein translocase subunit SecE
MSDRLSGALSRAKIRLGRALFRDRLGLVVFLGTVCVVCLFWRTDMFINDNETLVATLDALADGRLWIERVGDGPVFDSPGAEIRDGRVYGRNYGQLVVSLPALGLVWAIDLVADLRTGLVALWHLLVLGLFVQVGVLVDRRRLFALGGSALALGLFALNVAVLTPLADPSLAHLALQLTTVVAAGFVAVALYRLVTFEYDRRLGALVGLAGVLVAPVGFWATIPKRHVFSVLVCVGVLSLFAWSQAASTTQKTQLAYRGGAYALVGFLTWIHAAEGLFVFLALAAVDLPTGQQTDRRTLAVLASVFAISLVPAAVTNYLVTGSLIHPPRTLAGGGLHDFPAPTALGDSVSAGGLAFPVIGVSGWLISTVGDLIGDSLAVLSEPDRLYEVVVRSSPGNLREGRLEFAGTNLSILESFPVFGVAAATAASGVLGVRDRRPSWPRPPTVLAGAMIVAFVLLYLSRLPLHAQITQRYLLPVYPLGLYLLARSDAVRGLVRRRTVLWSYLGGVLIGGQLFVVYLVAQRFVVAEAAQFHARIALFACLICAVTGTLATVSGRGCRLAAAVLGLTGAVGTLFLVAGGLYYFAGLGDLLIAIVETVSDSLVRAV